MAGFLQTRTPGFRGCTLACPSCSRAPARSLAGPTLLWLTARPRRSPSYRPSHPPCQSPRLAASHWLVSASRGSSRNSSSPSPGGHDWRRSGGGGWEGRRGRRRRWKQVGWERRGGPGETACPVPRCHRLWGGFSSAPHVGRAVSDWLTRAFPHPPPPDRLTSPAGSALAPPARAVLGGAGAG